MYHGSGLPDFTNFMITNGPNGTVSDMAYDSLSHSLYIAAVSQSGFKAFS